VGGDAGAFPTRDGALTDAAPELVPGLFAEYFADYHDRVLSRVEPGVDHDWGEGSPGEGLAADRFSARWTGYLIAPVSGTYVLSTDNDDGVRLWVGDELVIDDWRGHFVERHQAEVALTADEPVAIRLDYFEIDLAASLRLSWSGPGRDEEVISSLYLRTTASPSELAGPKPPYQNPVIAFDCPDPGVLAAGTPSAPAYYAACTGGSFPVRTSRDLVFWTDTGAAILPDGKPGWAANGGRNWAPELHRVGTDFVAYYTSVNGNNVLSIGGAFASAPTGPYTDFGAPLVEHPSGVIDASFFEDDDGSRWLTYKIDGNAQGQPTPILLRKLAPDGRSFAPGSTETEILRNAPGTWEGGVVEAQWIVKRGGRYFMFYSGNVYDHRYRTGVARADSLTGPWTKRGDPILENNERWVGPGHGSVVRAGTTDYFVYHAWQNAGNGQAAPGGRHVLVDRIRWEDGWPAIHDGTPSRSPQPWPGEER
jgi:GH43 family beta-xylosidase